LLRRALVEAVAHNRRVTIPDGALLYPL
jgi:hypothetical protein